MRKIVFLVFFTVFLILGSYTTGFGKDLKVIKLPPPTLKGVMSLEEAILKRRSQRIFYDKKLDMAHISQLLWAAQGITQNSSGFRAAPSAGATYPLEIYLVSAEGIYHYICRGHKLELINDGNYRKGLSKACYGQSFVAVVPANFVITGIYSRTSQRYGRRAELYVHLEAGHVAQNILLQAVSLGLGGVPVGAFDDKEVKNVLKLPEDCEPLYVISVGYSK